jgi:predicted flap endonuclease-1-like 5' DNA nuclease
MWKMKTEVRHFGFSAEERKKMLAIRGVGKTVISRLEQIGFSSLAQLAKESPSDVTFQISQMMGFIRRHNSPHAWAAIRNIIALAQETAK